MEDQYIIISGTNRKDSNSYKVAQHYRDRLLEKGIHAHLLSLENLDLSGRNADFVVVERELLIPSMKFIFIAPEYNGSFPGVLKTLFDLSDYKKSWWGKKALLTGVSTGRSGNVRGMEHLTTVLNYLKVVVHPNKLPISSIDRLAHRDGGIHDPETLRAIDIQLDEFIKF